MPLNTVRLPGRGDYATAWLGEHPELAQRLLAETHGATALCLCRRPHPKMYIARRGETYYLARFPDTGPIHALQCASYTPDSRYSGRGGYAEGALTERKDGRISVRLDAPLDVIPRTAPAAPVSRQAATSRKARAALSLTGLLHLLWDQAQFNRWAPAMRGRRGYRQVYKFLGEAASGVLMRRRPLSAQLWIPEPFDPTKRRLIARRRDAAFKRLGKGTANRQRRILVVAQLKAVDIDESDRCALRLAHTPPNLMLACPAREAQRLRRQAGIAFPDWPAIAEELRVFVVLTMLCADGAWTIVQLAALPTDPHYLPVLSPAERLLIAHLVETGRYFYKPLPYDRDADHYPSVLLTDAGHDPVPLEISGPSVPSGKVEARVSACRENGRLCWHWDRGLTPHLPTRSIPRPRRPAARPGTTHTPTDRPQGAATARAAPEERVP